MSEDDEEGIAFIMDAIRRYFATRPEAADTAVGIHRWWLPVALREEPVSFVEHALDRLMDEGIARCTIMEDGSVIYASARHDEATGSPTGLH